MSGRGGGRGGRGGRGGGRGGRAGPAGAQWEVDTTVFDTKPIPTFPENYKPSPPTSLTPLESRQVSSLILFRRQFHASPLYTHSALTSSSTSVSTVDGLPKVYGQDQINSRYGSKSKATVDPFLAVPMYSHKFVREERVLPDLSSRPFVKEFFPKELWGTIEGEDRPGGSGAGGKRGAKRKSLHFSTVTTLQTAKEWLDESLEERAHALEAYYDADGHPGAEMTEEERQRLINNAANGGEGEEGEGGDVDLDEEAEEFEEEDDDYEDEEEGGDYNAEQYFDGGDDDGMDDDDGGGDGEM